jgi:hypothetical protein
MSLRPVGYIRSYFCFLLHNASRTDTKSSACFIDCGDCTASSFLGLDGLAAELQFALHSRSGSSPGVEHLADLESRGSEGNINSCETRYRNVADALAGVRAIRTKGRIPALTGSLAICRVRGSARRLRNLRAELCGHSRAGRAKLTLFLRPGSFAFSSVAGLEGGPPPRLYCPTCVYPILSVADISSPYLRPLPGFPLTPAAGGHSGTGP